MVAKIYSGTWKVEGEELVQDSAAGTSTLVFGDPSWSHYTLRFEVKPLAGIEGSWTFFHHNGPQNHLNFYTGARRNTVHGLGTLFDGTVKRRVVPGSIERDRWHTVELQVRGPACTAFLDGAPVLENGNAPFSRGQVGLGSYHTAVRFRRIEVRGPDGRVLFRGLPALPAS